MLLLRMAAAGCLASAGSAAALAVSPGVPHLGLHGSLAAHAAVSLCGTRIGTATQPQLAASQSPRALHWAGLALCAQHDAATRRRQPLAIGPRAFLFDIDGTLVLTDDIYFEAFSQRIFFAIFLQFSIYFAIF